MFTYHGSIDAAAILRDGFALTKPRGVDAGDFGRGIYTTTRRERAACYGDVVRCRIDATRYARVQNPYFVEALVNTIPQTEDEQIFYSLAFAGGKMLTVNGDPRQRLEAATWVRAGMLRAGYAGIVTGYGGEVVTYDLTTISAEPA